MAGIEDFVVEQIIKDFQNSPQAFTNTNPEMGDVAMQAPQPPPESSFTQEAKYNYLANRGMAPGAVSAPSAPQGFTIADPALREKYAQQSGELNARAATSSGIENAMRERDQQKFKILQGIHGLDPQIQAVILKRLGIDAGPIKSHIEQQKELLNYKSQLESPHNQVANAIKMMLATQGGQQHMNELALKERAQQQEAESRGQTHNIQLMRVLATLMQSDASGKLQQTLGPLLMQMLQGAGINLAPAQQKPAAAGASAGGRAGIKITRE